MSGQEPEYTRPDISLIGDEHVRRYEETDGEVGHEWNGATCLVLTTKGRKTGEDRQFALIYARDGDDYLVVASVGGMPKHPAWYLNLRENPQASIQVKAERFDVTARTAGDDEKPRLWSIVNDVWPNYDVYQSRTDRVIPVVVLYSELAAMFPHKSGGVAIYANEGWRKYTTLVGPVATFGYWIGWSVVLSFLGLFTGYIIRTAWFPGEPGGTYENSSRAPSAVATAERLPNGPYSKP